MCSRPSVLVIGGDPDFAGNVQDMLERSEYNVQVCTSGTCALQETTPHAPDIIILDLGPESDGADILAEIRRISELCEIIVIADHGSWQSAANATNAHAFAYLTKPTDLDQLLLTTNKALERKSSLNALRESEERFRDLFEAANDVILLVDHEGNIIDINRRAEELTGYTRDELLGMNVLNDLIVHELRGQMTGVVENLCAGESSICEVSWRTKSGKVIHFEGSSSGRFSAEGQFISTRCILRDVTGRRQVDMALCRREAELNSIFRVAPVGIGVMINRIIVEVNDHICEMTGYTQDELCGQSARVLYSSDDEFERVGRMEHAQIGEHGTGTMETKWQKKDGSLIDVLVRSTLLVIDDVSSGVTFTAMDITERKVAEHALKESEERYRRIVETASEGIVVLDAANMITFANDEIAKMLGVSVGDIVGKPLRDFLFEDGVRDHEIRMDGRRSGKRDKFERRYRRCDGSAVWCIVSAMPLMSESGEFMGSFGMITDITDLKVAEEALRRSEELYRSLVDTSPDPIVLADPCGNMLMGNARIMEMYGADGSPGFVGRSVLEFVAPEDQARIAGLLDDITTNPYVEIEVTALTQNRSRIPIEIRARAVKDSSGDTISIIAIVRDITQRKLVDQALKESEERFRTLTSLSPAGIYMTDATGDCLYANERWCEMAGTSEEDALGDGWVSALHPEDIDRIRSAWYTMARSHGKWAMEYRMQTPEGKTTWVYGVASAILDGGGEVTGYMGVNVDITEHKWIEEAHRLDESRLEALVHLNQMTDASLDTITSYALDEAVRLTQSEMGYLAFLSEDEMVLNMHSWSTKALDECRMPEKPLQYLVKDTGLWGEPIRQRRPLVTNDYSAASFWKKGVPDGHVSLFRHIGVPIFDNGRIVALVGVGNKLTDYDESDIRHLSLLMSGMWRIAERKKSEDALRKSEAVLSQAQQVAKLGSWEYDIAAGRLIWSDELRRILGLNPSQAAVQPDEYRNYIHSDDWPALDSLMRKAVSEGGSFDCELRVARADGTLIWVRIQCETIRDEQGRTSRVVGAIQDITDRKRADQALVESERRYRTLFNEMNEGFALHEIICDFSGKPCDYLFLDVNPAFERLTGLRRDAIIGKTVKEVLPSLDAYWIGAYGEATLTGEPVRFESFNQAVGRFFEVFAFCPSPGQFACFIADATERKEAEAALRESHDRLQALSRRFVSIQEEERRNMGRELHDQIGGSLTALSIALKLNPVQAEGGTDGGTTLAQELVSDLTSRIRELSLDLRPPMLDDLGLMPALLWYFERFTVQTGVQVDFRHTGAERRFPAEIETAAYRIAQEALTNTARYAETNEVTVRVFADEGTLHVQIEDQGIGFDVDAALSRYVTNGLTGMRERASLLGGTMVIESAIGSGTSLTATLPLV